MLNPFSLFFLSLALIESNDILNRKNEIKSFVATAKLELAVKRCIDFYRDFESEDDDDVILLSTTYYQILDKEKKGLWSIDEVMVRQQQLARRILQIIKDITNNYATAA